MGKGLEEDRGRDGWIEEDLEPLGVQGIVQDRERWRDVVKPSKTLIEL